MARVVTAGGMPGAVVSRRGSGSGKKRASLADGPDIMGGGYGGMSSVLGMLSELRAHGFSPMQAALPGRVVRCMPHAWLPAQLHAWDQPLQAPVVASVHPSYHLPLHNA